jgi:hypothetical protein
MRQPCARVPSGKRTISVLQERVRVLNNAPAARDAGYSALINRCAVFDAQCAWGEHQRAAWER